jgi:hypothetical protein
MHVNTIFELSGHDKTMPEPSGSLLFTIVATTKVELSEAFQE